MVKKAEPFLLFRCMPLIALNYTGIKPALNHTYFKTAFIVQQARR